MRFRAHIGPVIYRLGKSSMLVGWAVSGSDYASAAVGDDVHMHIVSQCCRVYAAWWARHELPAVPLSWRNKKGLSAQNSAQRAFVYKTPTSHPTLHMVLPADR